MSLSVMNQSFKYGIQSLIRKDVHFALFLQNMRAMNTFSRRSPSSKLSKIGINGFLMLIIPVGTFGLGTWQVHRRQWKLDLIKQIEDKTNEPPVPFPDDSFDKIEDFEYRKVKILGEFDHSQELYIGPRPLLVDGDVGQAGGSLISSGQSGYNVITPFKLSDKKITILVNRGWVSRNQLKPSRRPDGQITGLVELTGVVRKHENRAPFMPEHRGDSTLFAYRDVVKMAQMANTAPIFVDAVETIEGGPIGSQSRITLRNEHLSYIFTWYSLSCATSFLWFRKYILGKPLL